MSNFPAGALLLPAGADPYILWGMLSRFRGNIGEHAMRIDDLFVDFLVECDDAYAQQTWQVAETLPFLKSKFLALAGNRVCDGDKPGTGIYTVSGRLASLKLVLDELARPDPQRKVQRVELSSARGAPAARLYEQEQDLPVPARSAAGTVLVVIDDGFGFLNTRFRNGAQTRVHAFWDQDATRTVAPTRAGNSSEQYWSPVYRLGYGRELTSQAINELLALCPDPADEPVVYDRIKYSRVARTLTHGTQVAGWAAHGMTDDCEMILVQLPQEVAVDTSGSGTAKHVADALIYALERVRLDANVVVNVSFGAHAGPHDGSTLLELAMDTVTRREQANRNFAIVLPAGNAFNSACHAAVRIPAGGQAILEWEVRSDDPTESFCELWYKPEGQGGLHVSLVSPRGDSWGPAGPNRAAPAITQQGFPDTSVAVIHHERPQGKQGMAMVTCCLGPSMPLWGSWQPVPVGTWKIVLDNQFPAALKVDGWIQRDNAVIYGPYASRQAQFVSTRANLQDEDEDTDADPVKRQGTGNSIAHGKETLSVGACFRDELTLTTYSGMGIKREGRPWPDLLAPADRNRNQPGLQGVGTQSGTYTWMNGTSIAAPQVAALLLRLFDARPKGFPTTAALRAHLQEHEVDKDPPPAKSELEQDRRGGGAVKTHPHP